MLVLNYTKFLLMRPGLNPIENVFHIVRKMLDDEAIHLEIVCESFEEFKSTVMCFFDSVATELIDCTTRSMPK